MALILIAEDDPDIRGLLSYFLEKCGHQVEPSATGSAAVALAQRSAFDLVITDFHMPGCDGAEVVRGIRASETNARAPVILLTATARETDIAQAMAAGADAWLEKPFMPRRLSEIIDSLLHQHRDH